MNREELANKIKIGFQNVEYPGDSNIGGKLVDDFIGQKDWNSIPLDLLRRNQTELPFFTADAFRFFLPSFLYAILAYPEAEDMLGSVVPSLIPSESIHTKHIADHAIEKFAKAEKLIITDFLIMIKTLFPGSAYSDLAELRQEVDRATHFWESN